MSRWPSQGQGRCVYRVREWKATLLLRVLRHMTAHGEHLNKRTKQKTYKYDYYYYYYYYYYLLTCDVLTIIKTMHKSNDAN